MDYCYDFSDLTDNYEVLKAYHRHNNKNYVVDLRIQDEALRLTRIERVMHFPIFARTVYRRLTQGEQLLQRLTEVPRGS